MGRFRIMKKATIILALTAIMATAKGQSRIDTPRYKSPQDSIDKYRDIADYYAEIGNQLKVKESLQMADYFLGVYRLRQDSIRKAEKRRYIDSLKNSLQKKYKVKL